MKRGWSGRKPMLIRPFLGRRRFLLVAGTALCIIIVQANGFRGFWCTMGLIKIPIQFMLE
jgi:hypothetical protein